MTGRDVCELAASLLGCLLTAALIYGGTGVIDYTNDRAMSVSSNGGIQHGQL